MLLKENDPPPCSNTASSQQPDFNYFLAAAPQGLILLVRTLPTFHQNCVN